MPEELNTLIAGLTRPQKTVSPKYFYDETGSGLFEEITTLPEYYLTRTELGIMREHIDEMIALFGPQASLIEFGSGSSLKTRMLLEHIDNLAAYVPVDISEEHLLASQRAIQDEFPHIDVLPVVADFTHTFSLPNPVTMPLRNIVYFPGSTIGNFEHDDAMELLRVMYQEAGKGGALLIGVDLQKDPAVINAAYNDSAGVTARFNLNILRHLNREFGSNFDLDAFEHRAAYRPDEGRVAVELVSTRQQAVRLGDSDIAIDKDETILTEYSHKYTLDGFARMASRAGFEVQQIWTDPEQWFSVQFLVRD
ncbi:MAG: L-histidine N(alpha)-methyltransferase [Gammaproteobacteria bacterium]|nr:L-histidine N(alpha)-methyltransferase [Gammaproteobacteria bacterium]